MTLTPEDIASLVEPYVAGVQVSTHLYAQLATYLDLILKWNARTNLTAIREPQEIVRRHFGEGLFVGAHLGNCSSLLDFGSGAGFPGVPIQLLRPETQVTLAESQGKKASFLREVTRTLDLSCEVWAARVELMPEARQFHTVALRAVDDMAAAVAEAARRSAVQLAILTTRPEAGLQPGVPEEFELVEMISLPRSASGVLMLARRAYAGEVVPRGT
jgi:16S rRNA (guanine527-N7)-methyltransferase